MKKILNPPRGVIWDMDGVLVNTGDFHFQAWQASLSEFKLSITLEEFQSTFGMNNALILKTLYGIEPGTAQSIQISDRKETLFREAARGNTVLLPGVREWLERLHQQGINQAIATSAPPMNIEVLLEGLQIDSYLTAIVSGDHLKGKPDPAVFIKAAREIGIAPERCIVVEDAVAGVAGARNAGMKCIAVTTTNPANALSEADIVVASLDQLPPDAFERLWAA